MYFWGSEKGVLVRNHGNLGIWLDPSKKLVMRLHNVENLENLENGIKWLKRAFSGGKTGVLDVKNSEKGTLGAHIGHFWVVWPIIRGPARFWPI